MTYRIVKKAQITAAENKAFERGVDITSLIENAAFSVYLELKKRIKKQDFIAVFVGCGNNACDGILLARLLHLDGYRVEAVTIGQRKSERLCTMTNAFIAVGGKVIGLPDAEKRYDCYTVIADAVLGIGLDRPVSGEYAAAIELMNRASGLKVAVDIPSGINCDDGEILSAAFKADFTVTFGGYKYGHFLGKGADSCGEVVLKDVGLKLNSGTIKTAENSPPLPKRPKVGHKGDYGRIRIIGGSPTMIGAPILSALGALRMGGGLVTIAAAESLLPALRERVCEATLMPLPDKDGLISFDEFALCDAIKDADAIAIGMGMGKNPELKKIIAFLAANFTGTLVVDADGLNAIAGDVESLRTARAKVVLTPHRGEFFRLFGECSDRDAVEKTLAAAEKTGAVVVNKSNATIIACGESKEVYLNAEGSPAMAKGGSGDFLSGAIAALSVRIGAFRGAARAAYECGKLAKKAAALLGENAAFPSDLFKI